MKRPLISLVVVLFNMRREARRTLHSLSTKYQQEVDSADYEVHVVENGSTDPVEASTIREFGPNFYYHRLEKPPSSPAYALNYGVAQSRGQVVGLMIDGAHILTPRVLKYTKQVTAAVSCPIIAVRRFYLGPGQQPETVGSGYSQASEDELLRQIDWPRDPYRLFEIAAFMGNVRPGWFGRFWESNCLFLPRKVFDAFGGCDERFDLPGGGFLNLDLFNRCTEHSGAEVHMLLGEGSFHQVHGGTTTNAARDEVNMRVAAYRRQYSELRGKEYECPRVTMEFFGSLHPQSFLV